MSLNSQMIRQRDFSGGVIDPDAVRRDDLDLLKICLREGQDVVSTNTGALVPRPGRRFLFEDRGTIVEFKPFDDLAYRVVFVAGGVKIRTEVGAVVAEMVAPWAAEDLDTLVAETMDNEVFVAWDGVTQVITIEEGTLQWSIGPYEFASGIDGAVRVPFYRFSPTVGITMQPSAYSGTVTVTFSAPMLTAQHVGVIFRYAGRQLKITAVQSATKATAKILEALPPTYIFNLSSGGSGFSLGQIAETDTTNVKGSVVAVSGNTVTIVAQDKLTSPVNGERLVGPSGSGAISSFGSAATPRETVQWDEQFVSGYRGYPRSVSKDRQRLIFCNFAQFKSAVIWSAAGDNRDMAIGANPEDAIFEYISAECQVFHVVGGYDEFVITDKGAFYIPISVGTPLQPGSVEFRPIFSNELANVRPVEVTEGVIFIDKPRSGIYSISATGQTARPYIATEMNGYHRPLFDGVKSIAVTSGTKNFPTRQIYAVNSDGGVVIGQFNPARENVGWFPWGGAGAVRGVTGSYGKVIFMTDYAFGLDTVSVAEELDYDLLFDCATTLGTEDQSNFLSLDNGQPLTLSNGTSLTLSGNVALFYAGREVDVHAGGFYLGKTMVAADGVISGFSGYPEITIGVQFDWMFVPLFTHVEDGQPVGQGETRRKIEKMVITCRETQEFQCGARLFGSYRGGEDMSEPVPMRDVTYTYREGGRSYDPKVPFKSTFPCKFKLIELATRITV